MIVAPLEKKYIVAWNGTKCSSTYGRAAYGTNTDATSRRWCLGGMVAQLMRALSLSLTPVFSNPKRPSRSGRVL